MSLERNTQRSRNAATRFAAFVVIVSLFVIVDSQAGWAYYTTVGVGRGAATASTLSRPTSVSAAQSSASAVSVAWSKPPGFSGQPLDRYFVRRHDGSGSVDVCGSSAAAPIPGLSCVDADVPLGTFTYEVRTSYRSWSSAAASSSPVSIVADPPKLVSIIRSNSDPTNSASVAWTVQFSEAVTGVATANFALVATGITAATISSVTGSGTTWSVSASTGTGAGTLGLNLDVASGIKNASGVELATGLTGPAYTVRSMYPTSFILANGSSNNRIASSDSVSVTFSADVGQSSLCAARTDNAVDRSRSDGVVTVIDGGANNDSLTFSASGCPTLRFGSVVLGSRSYVTGGNATFTATIAYTVETRTIRVVFGSKSGSGSIGSASGSPVATFTPNAALTSTAGAAVIGTITSTGRF